MSLPSETFWQKYWEIDRAVKDLRGLAQDMQLEYESIILRYKLAKKEETK